MISCLFEADASVTETNRKLYDIVVNPMTGTHTGFLISILKEY